VLLSSRLGSERGAPRTTSKEDELLLLLMQLVLLLVAVGFVIITPGPGGVLVSSAIGVLPCPRCLLPVFVWK